jgi:hypothetical protein
MIAILDPLRELLEDLGGGLGVTDPVSGEVIVKLGATKPPKKRSSRQAGKAKRSRKAKR